MVKQVEGGFVRPLSEMWTDIATQERHPYWLATSHHTKDMMKFYTKAAAEHFVWMLDEIYGAQERRNA